MPLVKQQFIALVLPYWVIGGCKVECLNIRSFDLVSSFRRPGIVCESSSYLDRGFDCKIGDFVGWKNTLDDATTVVADKNESVFFLLSEPVDPAANCHLLTDKLRRLDLVRPHSH